jgi:hypothetical protein
MVSDDTQYPNLSKVGPLVKADVIDAAVRLLNAQPSARVARGFERIVISSLLAAVIAGSVVTAGATTGALGLGIIFGGIAGSGGLLTATHKAIGDSDTIEGAKNRIAGIAVEVLQELDTAAQGGKDALKAKVDELSKRGDSEIQKYIGGLTPDEQKKLKEMKPIDFYNIIPSKPEPKPGSRPIGRGGRTRRRKSSRKLTRRRKN